MNSLERIVSPTWLGGWEGVNLLRFSTLCHRGVAINPFIPLLKTTLYGRKKQPFKVKNLNNSILPGDFSVTFEKVGAKLGIVGLNTSFLQLTNVNYEGKLALHAHQFHQACGGDGVAWAKQHHVCLLLTHHPPSWLDLESQQSLTGEIEAHGRFAVHPQPGGLGAHQ